MARGGDMGGTPRLVMSSAVGQGMTQPWSNWDKQIGERERTREMRLIYRRSGMSVVFLQML